MNVPFQQTAIGCELVGAARFTLDVEGREVGIQVYRSRFVPWLRILRLPRFGRGFRASEFEACLSALRHLALCERVLRVHVEGWSDDPRDLARLGEACQGYGFRETPNPRSYRSTIWMDLVKTDEQLFAALHGTARRHIRAPAKRGFVTRVISHPRHAGRRAALHASAFRRTGAQPPQVDWPAAVEAARTIPRSVRIVGLFRADHADVDPLSFAMAFHHGDVVEYAFAGSDRTVEPKVPLLYEPTWELMRWGRDTGARWWDFGGITVETAGGDDPRGGISDFKRYFSKIVIEVGREWVHEPRPHVAQAVDSLGKLARGLFSEHSRDRVE